MADRIVIQKFYLMLSFLFSSPLARWAMPLFGVTHQTLISHRIVSIRTYAEVDSLSIPNQNTNRQMKAI